MKKVLKVVILCIVCITACSRKEEDTDSKLIEIKQEYDLLHPEQQTEKFEIVTLIPTPTPDLTPTKEPVITQESTKVETISELLSLIEQDLCDAIALQFYGIMPLNKDYIHLSEDLQKYMTTYGQETWGEAIYEIGGCATNISEDPDNQKTLEPGLYAYTRDENGWIAEILPIEEYRTLYGEPVKEDILVIEQDKKPVVSNLNFEFIEKKDTECLVIVTDSTIQETRKFTITLIEDLLDSIKEEK